ncbi:MAG TPA: T9SS type A sorting domain-containing protein [Flavobacteriales bacterium]|nr:T9SS type A sorting domain-containing protein [Flavobacteriales bacterium]
MRKEAAASPWGATTTFDSPSLPFDLDTLLNSGADDVFIAKLGSVITGVEQIRSQDGIRINPNPLTDRTTVRTHSPLSNATITIVDELGRTMKVFRNVNGSEITIHLDDLIAGNYILQIKQGDSWVAVEKLVIL